MKKLDYEQIMNIQENATKKLLNYIDIFFQKETNTKNIQFYYPNLDNKRTRMAFNVWVSLDYTTKYGKNFIEHFLEDHPDKLSTLEKEILIERNNAHISLFEVKNIKGSLMYIKDIICNKYHIIWEPELSKIINKSELIFGRVAKVIIYEKFVGDISFLPNSSKSNFLQKIFTDYKLFKKKENNASMEYYLKKYSLNVYRIYTECMYDMLGFNDKQRIKLNKELEEFQNFLSKTLAESTIKKHIKNLINLYHYILYDKDYTFSDFNKIDLDKMFKILILDDFIYTQNSLNSYIATLKKYIKFLTDKDKNKYERTYEQILEISKNRYEYFKPKEPIEIPLIWNQDLNRPIKNNLNNRAIIFLNAYEKYLFYIKNNKVEVSKTNKFIESKHLFNLNNLITQNILVKKSQNIKQPELPLLHLFYKFSLFHNILDIEKDIIGPSEKESEYTALKKYEKLALFINYIWNSLSSKKISIPYSKDEKIISLFEKMGLLTFKKDSETNLTTTKLGEAVFNIIKENENKKYRGKVINLNEWKKNR